MDKTKSAELILELYDLRRETVMREARNWIYSFFPKSAEEYSQTMMDPQVGAYLRMVTSYWDMAASFVNHGVIDAEMFNDVTGEHLLVYCKIRPVLADLREMWENPNMFKHLEKVIMDHPEGAERVARMEAWLADVEAQMKEQATAQTG